MNRSWSLLFVFLYIQWSNLCVGRVHGDECYKRDNGCCTMCNPGYLLYGTCGPCKPCPPNGYRDYPNTEPTCKRCQKCEGVFEYRSSCSATKNAVCKCIAGKKCADEKCSQCEKNPCPAGTQIMGEDCVNCPHGTFNPGTEGSCQPWKNCSAIDAVLYVNGTSSSDVVCLPKPTKIPSLAVTSVTSIILTKAEDVPAYELSIIIAVTSVVAIIMVFMGIFLCLSLRLEKIKNKFKKIKQAEEEDGCSYHYPEEEHGGEEALSAQP